MPRHKLAHGTAMNPKNNAMTKQPSKPTRNVFKYEAGPAVNFDDLDLDVPRAPKERTYHVSQSFVALEFCRYRDNLVTRYTEQIR
jgi:hypothetical protein